MEQKNIDKKEIISFFLSKGILLSPDILDVASDPDTIYNTIKEKIPSKDFLVLSKDIASLLNKKENIDTNWTELERAKTIKEKGKEEVYNKFIGYLDDGTKSALIIILIFGLIVWFITSDGKNSGKGNNWGKIFKSIGEGIEKKE